MGLVRSDLHNGKEYAQSLAIKKAKGDILIFSDVATSIPTDAITILVENFKDPLIGAVSSEDRFISENGDVVGEGLYVKYEMWLRKKESELGGIVGLSGSFFAARKEVCKEWDVSSPSDFNTALNCARNNLMAVSCPDVLGFYKDISDESKEYGRKVRTDGRTRHRHRRADNAFRHCESRYPQFEVEFRGDDDRLRCKIRQRGS